MQFILRETLGDVLWCYLVNTRNLFDVTLTKAAVSALHESASCPLTSIQYEHSENENQSLNKGEMTSTSQTLRIFHTMLFTQLQ